MQKILTMMKSSQLDSIGILASSLCMIHCIGTPFLFVAKACTATCCSEAPIWWKIIDYIFLVVSFVAIYFINKNSSNQILKTTFWVCWFILLITIIDHSLNILNIPKNFVYFPAMLIVFLHFYNLRFCGCKT